MNTSMSMAAITSTLRRHGGGRAYDRCGNRGATYLNRQNFAITIGKPKRILTHKVASERNMSLLHGFLSLLAVFSAKICVKVAEILINRCAQGRRNTSAVF